MLPPADEDAPNDELDRQVLEIMAAGNSKSSSFMQKTGISSFAALKASGEGRLTVTILLLAAVLVPLGWCYSVSMVSGFLNIMLSILGLSAKMFYAAIGWSLTLYPIAILIIFSILYKWMYRFSQASRMKLRPDGLRVSWNSGISKMLPWTDITSVFLLRPSNTMQPEKWLVGFGTAMTRPLNIRLPVAEKCGEALYELLRERCKWASIDPYLIEAWEPAISNSHTELWLKTLSTAPKESELMPLFPGRILREERYLILNRIGVGGQGTAYLARDSVSEAEVVLKENLLPVYVDAEVRDEAERRFRQEVELLSQLNNANVVRMIDSFVEDHRGYLVLEYIDGQSLRQIVKSSGPLKENRVIILAKQMATILNYLHRLEPPVVHRDFTPDNLLLNKQNELVLIDFNVARKLESNKTATVVGKHAYIPPEQFRGEADTRSDIYAFGATLFFLLCGKDPEPISQSFPSEEGGSISERLNKVVAKATALETSQRYQSAAEILQDL